MVAESSTPSATGGDAAPDARRLGVRQLAFDVIRSPRQAMERLSEHPGRRWIAPIAVLAVLALVVALQLVPRTMAAQMGQINLPPEMAEQASAQLDTGRRIGVIFGSAGAVLGTILTFFIGAGVLHLLGTVMGGQQAFGTVLSTTAWARVPLILEALVRVLWFGTHPEDFDSRLDGLAGLVADSALDSQGSLAQPFLSLIEVWQLWYLFLLWLAVKAFARISAVKAALVVAIFVALRLLLGLGMVWASGLFSGFGG